MGIHDRLDIRSIQLEIPSRKRVGIPIENFHGRRTAQASRRVPSARKNLPSRLRSQLGISLDSTSVGPSFGVQPRPWDGIGTGVGHHRRRDQHPASGSYRSKCHPTESTPPRPFQRWLRIQPGLRVSTQISVYPADSGDFFQAGSKDLFRSFMAKPLKENGSSPKSSSTFQPSRSSTRCKNALE